MAKHRILLLQAERAAEQLDRIDARCRCHFSRLFLGTRQEFMQRWI